MRLPLDGLEPLVAGVLSRRGVPAADAAVVARHVVAADLLGRHAHGVFRLPALCRRIDAGGITLAPEVRQVAGAGAVAVLDGDDGIGHLVMDHAVRRAVALAREHGIGWVGTRRSNHAGAGGVWTGLALRERMIGLYTAVASANHMAPLGGVDALLGTNPLAVAVPASGAPDLQLDMASTVASWGEVKRLAAAGQPIPEGWLVGPDGGDVTDPADLEHALLQPIGGHKGYGLTLVLGLLAGALNGAAVGGDVVDFNHDDTTTTDTGQTIIVVRPDAFGDPDAVAAAVGRHLAELAGSTPVPGGGAVRVPGDRAAARAAAVRADGVPVPTPVAQALADLATEAGLPDPRT